MPFQPLKKAKEMTKFTPRLVTTEHGRYESQPFDGINRSGIKNPLGDRIVVLPDEAAKTIGSKGLLIATNDTRDTHSLGAVTGTIIAIGDDAWRWDSTRTKAFAGERPKPGDRVIFNRYSGQVLLGLDGKNYRIMSESTIGGILDDKEGTTP